MEINCLCHQRNGDQWRKIFIIIIIWQQHLCPVTLLFSINLSFYLEYFFFLPNIEVEVAGDKTLMIWSPEITFYKVGELKLPHTTEELTISLGRVELKWSSCLKAQAVGMKLSWTFNSSERISWFNVSQTQHEISRLTHMEAPLHF